MSCQLDPENEKYFLLRKSLGKGQTYPGMKDKPTEPGAYILSEVPRGTVVWSMVAISFKVKDKLVHFIQPTTKQEAQLWASLYFGGDIHHMFNLSNNKIASI